MRGQLSTVENILESLSNLFPATNGLTRIEIQIPPGKIIAGDSFYWAWCSFFAIHILSPAKIKGKCIVLKP